MRPIGRIFYIFFAYFDDECLFYYSFDIEFRLKTTALAMYYHFSTRASVRFIEFFAAMPRKVG